MSLLVRGMRKSPLSGGALHNMKHAKFIKSAAVMTAGFLVAKAIGAFYRISLTGILGGYGIGLYQMAYPLFLLFLTFSSAGIPSALSRVVSAESARGRETTGHMKTALRLFALIGLFGALLMCAVAALMSGLQGDENLTVCYLALAPSVFLVALVSVLRGYFQGKNDMGPTAFSEIVEQAVKAGFGFFAASIAGDPVHGAALALLGVSLSELGALIYLVKRYKGERRIKSLRRINGYSLFHSVLPVMAAAALLPLSRTLDSIVIVRLMARYTGRAVSLYGLYSGGVMSLIDLPATLAGGLVAAAIPLVSSSASRGDGEGARRNAALALLFTFALSVPCAVFLFAFASPVVRLLYASLSESDLKTVVALVRLSSVSAVSLAAVNTLSACLTGMGRAKCAAKGMLVAVVVKLILQCVLVSNPALSVGGAAIASNVCYLVAFFLDSVYTWKVKLRTSYFAKKLKSKEA